MDLETLQILREVTSVEEIIENVVRGKTPEDRLDVATGLIGLGLEAEERIQEVVVKAWELTVREEWWKARYGTLREFISMSGMAEGVLEIIERRKRTEGKKRSYEAAALKRWGGKDLAMILGVDLMPRQASKGFLEAVQTLSGLLPDVNEAVELLEAERNTRLGRPGERDKQRGLLVQDVRRVLEGLKGRAKRARFIKQEGSDGGPEWTLGTFELGNGTDGRRARGHVEIGKWPRQSRRA